MIACLNPLLIGLLSLYLNYVFDILNNQITYCKGFT